MVGHLDMDELIWNLFIEGKSAGVVYDDNDDGAYQIIEEDYSLLPFQKNMNRLTAGLDFNCYTEKYASISDISQITYIYGDRDQKCWYSFKSRSKIFEG